MQDNNTSLNTQDGHSQDTQVVKFDSNNQWQLFKTKNFWPLFFSQLTGAFNDNLYKNAIIIMLAFTSLNIPGQLNATMAVNACAAFFILPFFLFSAVAGEIADSMDKSVLIYRLKLAEIAVAVVCVLAVFSKNVYFMWAGLFLFGTQAAFFGPVKYSILPQHIGATSLIGANALVESGTFVAILAGTIVGSTLILVPQGEFFVSGLILALAGVGAWCAKYVPVASAMPGASKPRANIFVSSWEIIAECRKTLSVWRSILAISWFWFFGATLLSQFPVLVKETIGANQSVVTLFLVVFSLGIAIGSVLCEKLSSHKIEIGLVPFGAIGMAIFIFDFYFSVAGWNKISMQGAGIFSFWNTPGSHRMIFDLALLSVFGGFFIVPLYSIIQTRTSADKRSRAVGANNIMNACFMVCSAAFAALVVAITKNTGEILFWLAVVHVLVAAWVFYTVPEFLLRFLVWILVHSIYRVKKHSIENMPEVGPAIIVANHVSFVDALVIFGCAPVPVKFVMYYKIYQLPVFNWLFKSVGAIPIASKHENEEIFNSAFDQIGKKLQEGEIVVIFPEGAITKDGEVAEFKPGILKILKSQSAAVPVTPAYIGGLWGSAFSRREGLLSQRVVSLIKRKTAYLIGLVAWSFSPSSKKPLNTKINLSIGQAYIMDINNPDALIELKEKVLALDTNILPEH